MDTDRDGAVVNPGTLANRTRQTVRPGRTLVERHEGAGPLALVAASGGRLSYRQLDYWCRTRWIKIEHDGCGSGSRRTFTKAEWDAVLAMLDELDALQARFELIHSGQFFADKVKEATDATSR